MKLSVLIPVYNEENTVADLLEKVLKIKGEGCIDDLEIVAVDDCSSDGTGEYIKNEMAKEGNKIRYFKVGFR